MFNFVVEGVNSLIASLAALSLYFAPNSESVTIAISAYKLFAAVGTNLLVVITINSFPTTLRWVLFRKILIEIQYEFN